jgi:hypothetical protein
MFPGFVLVGKSDSWTDMSKLDRLLELLHTHCNIEQRDIIEQKCPRFDQRSHSSPEA